MAAKRESRDGQADDDQQDPVDRQALARVVTAGIESLRITRKELEKRSGVSTATIREIEHPKKRREFGRKILEALSEGLGWPAGYLVRVAYRGSSEDPDPIVLAMMTALAPYLEKIDAIPELQTNVAAIKVHLDGVVDAIHEVSGRVAAVALDVSRTHPTK